MRIFYKLVKLDVVNSTFNCFVYGAMFITDEGVDLSTMLVVSVEWWPTVLASSQISSLKLITSCEIYAE